MENKNILRGLIYTAAGFILLLYTTGQIETGIETILITASIILMLYGLYLLGTYQLLRHYIPSLTRVKERVHPQNKSSGESDENSTRNNKNGNKNKKQRSNNESE